MWERILKGSTGKHLGNLGHGSSWKPRRGPGIVHESMSRLRSEVWLGSSGWVVQTVTFSSRIVNVLRTDRSVYWAPKKPHVEVSFLDRGRQGWGIFRVLQSFCGSGCRRLSELIASRRAAAQK